MNVFLFTGESCYEINVHNLLHLAEYVDLHGPLFENSLFPFEAYNGFISSICHAKNNASASIMKQILANQIIQAKTSDLENTKDQAFCDRVKGRR